MTAYTSANCVFVKNLHFEYLLHLVPKHHLITFLVFGILLNSFHTSQLLDFPPNSLNIYIYCIYIQYIAPKFTLP